MFMEVLVNGVPADNEEEYLISFSPKPLPFSTFTILWDSMKESYETIFDRRIVANICSHHTPSQIPFTSRPPSGSASNYFIILQGY
jgi:hypothetical protein